MERIDIHRYTLRSAEPLNSRSNRLEHEGALIRVDGGYGCIHPWPELGDEPLDLQLKVLAAGGSNPLISAARECAAYDASLRRKGCGLPGGLIPESHWLVLPGDSPDSAREEGFHCAKIKASSVDADLRREILRWFDAGFRIRLDFNESLASGAFLPFWKELSDEERAGIDFVEDPESYSEAGWNRLRVADVPLAVDRDAEDRWVPGDIFVVKPSRPAPKVKLDSRLLVTSYMDHAIGQMFAAHKAAEIYEGELRYDRLACGLLTHRCFENDEFFERIRCEGPRLLPVEGTGLGFDDLLEKLPWKRLN